MRLLDMHAHSVGLSEEYARKLISGMEEAADGNEISGSNKAASIRSARRILQLAQTELELRRENGIVTCFSAGTPEEWEYLQKFRSRGEVLMSFGIHPWYSDRYDPSEYPEYFRDCDYIGEIGMDSVWCSVPSAVQRRNMEKQLQIAADLGKSVLLHTKGREAEIAEMIKGFPNPVCVHWYSGDIEAYEKFLAGGCYFTLGPDFADVCSRAQDCREETEEASAKRALYHRMLHTLPENRIFMETDGISAVAWARSEECTALSEIPKVLEENMCFFEERRGLTPEMLQCMISRNLHEFLYPERNMMNKR